ncbi:hypothetical protein ACKQTC_06310 [Peptococcus simiae]|uniref:Asp23/Gls24 family envelope stress response protein n=1 Tax=Peptococcus simiae TaxID=1643805 RepID=A0ABW9GZC2_9FIRM
MSKKKKQNKKNKRPYYDFSSHQGQTARGPVSSKDYAADYGHNPYDAYVSGDSVPPLVHRTRGGEHGRQGQQNVPQGPTGLRRGSLETSRQIPVRYGDYASAYGREYTGATAPYDRYVQPGQGSSQVPKAPMTYTGDYQGNAYDCYYGTGQDDGYCDWQFGQAGPAGPQGPGMFQEAPHRAPAHADGDYGVNAYDCYYGTGGDDGYCAIHYQGPTAQSGQPAQAGYQAQGPKAPMTYTGDYQGNAYDCYYGTGQDDGYCDWQFGQAGPAGPQGPGMFQEAPHRAPAHADGDYGANAYDCYYGTGGDDGYCAINYQGPTAQSGRQPQAGQQAQGPKAPMTYTGDYQGNAYDCYYGTGQDDGYCDWQFGQAGPAGPQGPGMFQEAPHRAPAHADGDYGANAYDCYYGTGGDDGYCAINYQGPTAQSAQQPQADQEAQQAQQAQPAQPAQVSAPAAGQPAGDQGQGQSRTFSLSREALQKVFAQAVADIDGLLALDGHMASSEAGQAAGQVDLNLQAVLAYGAKGKEVFRALSDSLDAALQDQAGLSVHTCHVEVVDIMVREDFNDRYQSQAPDKQKDQRAEKKAKDKDKE